MKKRLLEIGKFFLEGKNWGYFVVTFFFLWTTAVLFWFGFHHIDPNAFWANAIRPSGSLRILIGLSFLLYLSHPCWIKGKVETILKTSARSFGWLLMINIILLGLPYLTILKNFNTPWFSFDWIVQESHIFQLFGFCLSTSVFINLFFLRPLLENNRFKQWQTKYHHLTKYIPWFLFLLGFVIYGLFSLFHYNNFDYPLKDLGIFDQAVWHLSQFKVPASSIREMTNLWGDHFHPILVILAPLYWIKSDPRTLLMAQALIVSAGVLPIYWIAQDKLKSYWLAFSLSLSWLFFLGIQHAIDFGFYPETLAVTFIAFALYFLWQNKNGWFWCFIILALFCKENISLYLGALGIYLYFFEKRKTGLILVIFCLVWLKFTLWLIPYINHGQYMYFRYGDLGQDPLAIINTIFTNPLYTLKIFLSPEIKIQTILLFFTPLAFLPFFSPFFIVLLPNLAEKFLSNDARLWSLGFHYAAGISTFLITGAILGLKNLGQKLWFSKIKLKFNLGNGFIGLLLIFLNLSFLIVGRAPLLDLRQIDWKLKLQNADLVEAYALIPPDASVEAQNSIGLPLAHREKIEIWYKEAKSDFVILSPKRSIYPLSLQEYQQKIKTLYDNSDYGLIMANENVMLFKRGAKTDLKLPENLDALGK